MSVDVLFNDLFDSAILERQEPIRCRADRPFDVVL